MHTIKQNFTKLLEVYDAGTCKPVYKHDFEKNERVHNRLNDKRTYL